MENSISSTHHTDQTALIESQARHIQELKDELCIVKRQLQQFLGRQMNEIAERRRSALQFYREQYELRNGLLPQSDCVESADEDVSADDAYDVPFG